MRKSKLNLSIDQSSSVPLYEQISQHLRDKIESRELEPGTRLPTSHQLCAQLQVSYKTAHQAMSKLAREGWVTRKASRGTVVKGVPRRGVIGIHIWSELLDHDPIKEFYRLSAQELCRQLEDHGRVYRMYLGTETPGECNLAEEDLLRHFTGGGLSGVVIINALSRTAELVEHSRSLRIPVVSFTARVGMDYSMLYDNVDYMGQAATYLAGRGRQRVGVVYNGTRHDDEENHVDVGRILIDRGCKTRKQWIVHRDTTLAGDYERAGYEAAASLPLQDLDGLIINDDVMALGVARRLCELGLDIPRDLHVTTAWNRGSRLELGMPFTRFEFDVARYIGQGVQLLEDAIRGQRIEHPHQTLGPTDFNVPDGQPHEATMA